MNKNDIDCYRYIIDSSVSTIRNNDYIIIHNSMEVVQYIIYIYISLFCLPFTKVPAILCTTLSVSWSWLLKQDQLHMTLP